MAKHCLLAVILGCSSAALIGAEPLATWHVRTLPDASPNENLNSVAFGNGRFVIGGDDGSLFSSPDGVGWSKETSPTTKAIDDIAFAGGTFVAVGGSQLLMTSPDGRAWTSHPSPFSGARNIIHDGTRFVVVLAGGFVSVSPDGVQWTNQARIPNPYDIGGVAFGNGIYVEAGYKRTGQPPNLFSTPDLQTWTPRTANVDENLMNVSFVLGQFIAVGQEGVITTSPDGTTWTPQTSRHTGFIWDVAEGGQQAVAAAQWGRLLSSSNGADWTIHETGLPWHFLAVTFGQDTFVAVGWDGQVVQSDPVGSTDAGPRLRIQRTAPGVTISWPISASGFALQTRPSLTTGTWAPANEAVVDTAAEHTVTLPTLAPGTIWRLAK